MDEIIAAVGLTRGFCMLMEANLSESRIITDDANFSDWKMYLYPDRLNSSGAEGV